MHRGFSSCAEAFTAHECLVVLCKGRVPLVQRRAAHVFFDAQGRFVAERRSHWCNCASRTGQIYEFLGFSRSLEHLKGSTFMTTRASKAILCALCRDFSATRARECSPRIVEKTGKMCVFQRKCTLHFRIILFLKNN